MQDLSKLTDKVFDFRWFAERFFCIRDRAGNIVPFKMNPLQEALYAELVGSDDVLKARKGGVSTLVVLMMLHKALTSSNYRGLILAHEHKSAIELFEIARTAYENLPDQIRPGLDVDSRQEMKFRGLNSRMSSHTARNPQLGRGGTIDDLHCSEIAFWDFPETTLTAVGASLGQSPRVFRESTANGAGTFWHVEWIRSKNGQSGYRPHFFSWMVEPSYRADTAHPVSDPDEFDENGKRVPFELTERERELKLDEGQARWRRRQVRKFGSKFPQEYAEDDATCFLTTGRTIFDNMMIQRRYEQLVAATNLVRYEDPSLGLKVYWELSKRERSAAEFVIGADTAEGIADPGDPSVPGDFCAGYVLEKHTGLMVASIHGSWEPYEFARVLNRVARMYRSLETGMLPLLGVERNNHGHAVLSELRNHLHYSNLYWHEDFDEVKQKRQRKLGWVTDRSTRPIMVDSLVKAVNNRNLKVTDPDFYAECLTFTRNEKGKPCAQSGCHDDRIMAAAIAWQMRQRSAGAPLVAVDLP